MSQPVSIDGRQWVIYLLLDPRTSECRYVGVTFRGARIRLNEHLCRARTHGRTHRDRWVASLLKLDLRPVMQIVETGFGEGWQEVERRWIATQRACSRLTNRTDGGEGTPGCLPSDATRALWSRNRKGKKYSPGRRNGMLGKTHSAEVRERARIRGLGRCQSEEAKRKLSLAHAGKILTPEHRKKLAAAKRGKKLNDEHKASMRASASGHVAVICVETGEQIASMNEAARRLGLPDSSIYQACKRGVRAGRFHWRRATDG